ncbi:hypothetical protein D8O27_09220 [Burkholderia mallei]|uniref:Uncharacterized protein n=1 Tax=Burkholderia mallei TaxID=13373 RepID=A0AAX1XCJ3_BURML|nr:conserved hypothetical protein [Burkholderia mallei SAVP1]AIW48175.1 hypothetical protein DM57_09110 [Burkholderia mallei]EEP86819.1 conserved hypothetical protein [Burkholderia mallei GB8 horse 4]EES46621.1 conserved hypothetical protein [Burkholderia mallei PRL-20]AOP69009.1 hypothetical protein BHL98_03765 [Burkholderia mallei]
MKNRIQGASHGIRRGRAPPRKRREAERHRRRDAGLRGEIRAARFGRRRALRRRAAPCDDAPLTLYGAYRQGFADYLAGRPNPYRIGSRLAGIWHEGHAEAASNDALDFAVRVRFCWGARAAANPIAFFRRRR